MVLLIQVPWRTLKIMSKPIAVLISDIHYNVNTLPLADSALRQALEKARELNVILIVAGDLLDNKAIIRAECANALLKTLDQNWTVVYILVGNHDLINVKGSENSLNFLARPEGPNILVSSPHHYETTNFSIGMLPYYDDPTKFKEELFKFPKGSIVIAHQGFLGAEMGMYAVDNSSVDPNELKDYKIISGHYHKHQTVGPVTYIGNPYTLSFGEANDGLKGFQVLNDDGSLTFVSTKLRKHVIINMECIDNKLNATSQSHYIINNDDLVWVKVTGRKDDLEKLTKNDISSELKLSHTNFKLDKIQIDNQPVEVDATKFTGEEMLDKLIDNTTDSVETKQYIKQLWREIL